MCPQEITSLSSELVVFHSFGGVGYSGFVFIVFFLLNLLCLSLFLFCFLHGRDNEIMEQLESGRERRF